MLLFGNKNQCGGADAALAELEAGSRSCYSALPELRQDGAISIGFYLLHILPQAPKTIQIAVKYATLLSTYQKFQHKKEWEIYFSKQKR